MVLHRLMDYIDSNAYSNKNEINRVVTGRSWSKKKSISGCGRGKYKRNKKKSG